MRKALYRFFSIVLMVASMALVALLALPSFTGVSIMSVESGSMEPTISTRDMVVVLPCEAEAIEVGDIVSYSHGGTTVTHRVTANRPSLGELETKGDANEYIDLEPVPYENIIGKMRFLIPESRELFNVLSSAIGKVYVLLGMVAAILLWIRSNQVGMARDVPRGQGGDAQTPRRRHRGLAIAIKVVLLGAFLTSAGLIVRYRLTQKASMDVIQDARTLYEVPTGDSQEGVPQGGAPIHIDFDAMISANPDVVGWLYCEGTQIDFPVLKGDDNDFYLRRNWKKEKDMCGSIFVDADASDGFADARTVVYGHHMNDNLMFASLEDWGEQEFYEAHPTMWLLTPAGDYRVELVAGEHIPAESDAYMPAKEHNDAFSAWLASYVGDSDFKATTVATPDSNYVMLSTCAYVYENARFTLLGKLVAV